MTALKQKILLAIGAVGLLLVIFGVPAVLVPFVMDDIPNRATTKVISRYAQTIEVVEDTFARHRDSSRQHGRLAPLPESSEAWINLVNPMNRQAPGGDAAVLPKADAQTGAIGLEGNRQSVTITLPAYRDLPETRTIIPASGES